MEPPPIAPEPSLPGSSTPAAAPPPPPPATSLASRLLNVFAMPGEVFDEVKASPSSAMNWLVPMFLLGVVGAIIVAVMFSQPALRQQIRDQQVKAMDEQVKAGKMRQEDADKAITMIEKVMKPVGIVMSWVIAAGRVVWWGFILWLLGRVFLKASFSFPKSLEVAGLAFMVAVLGGIVTFLLMINFSRVMATPSLALAINDFDIKKKSHLMMGAINVFSFWQVALMGLGLARLAQVPFFRAALVVSVYWVVQELLLIVSGMGQMAL